MSLYESSRRNAASGSKAGLEYLLVYTVCFVGYLVPVVIRRISALGGSGARYRNSVIGETSEMAANRASSSFVGL